MPVEPTNKRAVVFVDGQNLYHAVRESFGYTYPNYDIRALAQAVCAMRGWNLVQARFYTGVPHRSDDADWHHFWMGKLRTLSWQGVHTYTRRLRYRNKRIKLTDGREHTFMTAEEKGIDVRIAIDVIRLAHRNDYDVAIIFSQDQDLSEVADEIRVVAREQDRWIKVAAPSPSARSPRMCVALKRPTGFRLTGQRMMIVSTSAITGSNRNSLEATDSHR